MGSKSWGPMADGGQSQFDRVLEAISSSRCRYALYALAEAEPQDLESLTETVLEWEAGRPVEEVPEDHRERVRTSLHHQQLPRLADLRIVEYDPRSKMVRYRDPPQHLEDFLAVCQEIDAE